MAGRIKHMKRSHRSYGKNYSEFNRFAMRASSNKYIREQKKSISERISSLFARMFHHKKNGGK